VSPEHRKVLALSNALGPAEIAQVLGVSPDTAETLVREARWHLEQAAASVDPADAAMLAPLTGDALHRLVTLGYVPSAAQRERVLSACVAALHAPGGAAVFGADGRPLPPDAYAAQADDVTHQFPAVSAEDPVTEPLSRFGGVSADTRPDLPLPIVGTGGGPPLLPDGHPRAGRSSLGRRLIPVVALVACAAAASGAALAWPRPHHTGQTTAVVHETPRRTAEPTPSHDRPSPAKSPKPHRTTSPSGRADRPVTPTREPARSPSPTHRATPHRTPGGGHRTAAPGRTCLGPFGPYRCPRPHSWPPPEVDPYG
jgi:hypothetical protein